MRITTRKILTLVLVALMALPLLALTGGCKSSQQGQGDPAAPQGPAPIINPLTGKTVASLALIKRRPLAVKVENDPGARPQSGLPGADIVYEEIVEGGITRFIALYLSQDVSVIGPMRSARPSDIDIAFFHLPLLACSGGEKGVMSMVKASGIMVLEEDGAHFWRDKSRRAPHNLYTSTALLREGLASWQDDYNQLPTSGLIFMSEEEAKAVQSPESENGTVTTATAVDIDYGNACSVHYDYSAQGDGYLRTVNGKPNMDLTTGAQLQPTNVIVQYVEVVPSGLKDVLGTDSPNSLVIGTGKAVIFSGGNVFQATWKKDNRNLPTVYLDWEGKPIELRPGQTWINLIPERIALAYQ